MDGVQVLVESNPKKFCFADSANSPDQLNIVIPEQLHASYGMYTWPCAPVLAWYLWTQRSQLPGKQVLEIGAGTSLPGIVAAKCGAKVTLSDCTRLTRCLDNCRKSVEANDLLGQVDIIGITWGSFEPSLLNLKPLDLILGSDCFYDPNVFEPILVTVSFLLERNPNARFLCAYKERSGDWTIEPLLYKWNLVCQTLHLERFLLDHLVDVAELTQDHSIQLFEIRKA